MLRWGEMMSMIPSALQHWKRQNNLVVEHIDTTPADFMNSLNTKTAYLYSSTREAIELSWESMRVSRQPLWNTSGRARAVRSCIRTPQKQRINSTQFRPMRIHQGETATPNVIVAEFIDDVLIAGTYQNFMKEFRTALRKTHSLKIYANQNNTCTEIQSG